MIRSLVLLLCLSALAAAGETAVDAKALQAQHGPSLVIITGTVKTSMKFQGNAMPGQESRLDTYGVVIDADGTVVTSATLIDSSRMMQKAMRGSSGGGMDTKMEVSSEHTNLRLRLADGTQVPATLALIDADRDLAVLRPDGKDPAAQKLAGKWPALTAAAAEQAAVLDQVLVIERLPAHFDRQIAVVPGDITAQIAKPRPCWLVRGGSPGGVVLTRDGRCLGLVTIQIGEDVGMSTMFSMGSGMAVAPLAEIRELARSAAAPAK
jgi:hypothetical protein